LSVLHAQPLQDRLYRSLGDRAPALRALVRIAVRCGAPPYLVGGPVRDLLSGRRVLDVDLLLPDRLEAVARAGETALGGRAVLRPRFLTATLEVPGLRIDLSRARRERYPRPGALPVVRPASIEADLGRRDFSLNAMALPLFGGAAARLLDPHGGREDLRRRRLRALHDRSFLDDPTRALRAARYAARFALRLEPATAAWLRRAIGAGALDAVSGDRIRHEIERLVDEPHPERAARLARRWGLTEAIAPGWSPGRQVTETLERLGRARARPPWREAAPEETRRAAGLRALLLGVPPRVRARALARLAIRGRPFLEIEQDLDRLAALRRSLARARRASSVDALLAPLGWPALLLAYCSAGEHAARAVLRYARSYRRVRTPFDGNAARRFGASGPDVGALLRAARRRALDGLRVDESWARSWLERRG
jgi:tRNA nucleotidyltransferase (CCA-adding enzyme)